MRAHTRIFESSYYRIKDYQELEVRNSDTGLNRTIIGLKAKHTNVISQGNLFV